MHTRMEFKPSPLTRGTRPPGVTSDNAPLLAEWVTLTEAAQLLGLTRQMIHRMARSGYFVSLHRIGAEADSRRSILVVRRSEIMAEAARRDDATARLSEHAKRITKRIAANLEETA